MDEEEELKVEESHQIESVELEIKKRRLEKAAAAKKKLIEEAVKDLEKALAQLDQEP